VHSHDWSNVLAKAPYCLHKFANVAYDAVCWADVAAAVNRPWGKVYKMVKLTSAKLVGAVSGMALSLTTGAGVASADPDFTPLVETTCTYPQAIAALNALSPEAAQEFNTYPMASAWLHTFLASGTDQRWQLLGQAQTVPALQPYTELGLRMAGTCSKY
jgi:hemophore-related protein